MAEVVFESVGKVYPDGTRAVHDLTLSVADGEFMIFVGPSGCGKTTALRMVAGLEEITDGNLRIGPRVVNDLDCGERDIAMVFQNYALYPHMTVAGNMDFPLRLAGFGKAERAERIATAARVLGLEPYLGRRPARLSGGQRQRVAMGRALVRQPSVFLMDEPLSNLDAKLRIQMRAEITALQRQLGITTIYVTHDQVEALTMGDRIAVMRDGQLQQVADPMTLYDAPANLFVAAFIGAPAMNLVEGRIGSGTLAFGTQRLTLGVAERVLQDGDVVAGLRPEALRVAGDGPAERRLFGYVHARESVGSDLYLTVALDRVPALSPQTVALAHVFEDRAETETLLADRMARITVRLPPVRRFAPGDRITLDVPEGALHLFDKRTGRALTRACAPRGQPGDNHQDHPSTNNRKHPTREDFTT